VTDLLNKKHKAEARVFKVKPLLLLFACASSGMELTKPEEELNG